ncbi:hypothetical protein KW787_02105 [Candidatus Pacearchaeota archaeon]|nr:hypothetical protein [Candidatus Pacearchaeota archaeon]
MDNEEIMRKLKEEGFVEVYEWIDEPNKFYSPHSHEEETKLVITDGEMVMKTNSKDIILKKGSFVHLKRNQVHEALVGPNGCKYVVGEK